MVEARTTSMWREQYESRKARSATSRFLSELRVIEADWEEARGQCGVMAFPPTQPTVARASYGIALRTRNRWQSAERNGETTRSGNVLKSFATEQACAEMLQPVRLTERPGATTLHVGEVLDTLAWFGNANTFYLFLNSPRSSVRLLSVRDGLAEFSVCFHQRWGADPQTAIETPFALVGSGHWFVTVKGMYPISLDFKASYYVATTSRPVGEYRVQWMRSVMSPVSDVDFRFGTELSQ